MHLFITPRYNKKKNWRGAAGHERKTVRERSVGFTDASYIRQDDAPNTPRCYSFAEEQLSGTKKTASPLCVGGFVWPFFVLALFHDGAFRCGKRAGSAKTAVPAPLPESAVAEGSISGTAETLRGRACRHGPRPRRARPPAGAPISASIGPDRELCRGGVL